ncbi:hypothetical protein M885DRAFT_517216 [Pelagophyceae sp. CCMP2097]|nr:hypothetical protein M885DRAFT_517216 [Pelagophyceae sp. CCMP2097]
MGFGAGGIVKGSPAAYLMSVEWLYGGGVGRKMKDSGLTASLQSVGATGRVCSQAAHVINRALQSPKASSSSNHLLQNSSKDLIQ